MKKLLIILGLVAAMVLVMSAVAYAGGWWVEYGTSEWCEDATGSKTGYSSCLGGCADSPAECDGNTADGGQCNGAGVGVEPGNDTVTDCTLPDGREVAPSDFPQLTSPPWGNPQTGAGEGTDSPHLGFSTSSNLCKTCHAVHLAGPNSYRLLQDISRMTECDACHDATTGRSSHRPYGELFLLGKTVRGEHTLRTSTLIPDSNVNKCDTILGDCPGAPCTGNPTCPTGGCTPAGKCDTPADKGRYPNRSVGDRTESGQGLYCFDCHSVHGANRLTVVWGDAIVRADPAGNGGDANVGHTGTGGWNNSDWAGGVAWGARSAFCADCHNLNANFDDEGDTEPRPNPRSHVFGDAADGQMEVYHTTVTDSWSSKLESGRNPRSHGCRACHSGNDHYHKDSGGPEGDWPHQTQGHKLLADAYTAAVPGTWPDGPYEADAAGETVGDSQRPLPEMDKICVDCHTSNGDGTGDGVGNTY